MHRTTLLTALLFTSTLPAAETTWRAEVRLDEGSVIVGELHTDDLKLRVGGRTSTIPLPKVVAADRVVTSRVAGPRWAVTDEEGRTVTGELLTKSVRLESLVGEIDVPLARAVELAVYPDGGAVELPAKDDLVLYVNFDRRPRDVVRNLAGPRHHGTVNGVKWLARGKRRGACEFDGPARIEIPHHPDLCPEKFTLAMWARAADPTGSWRLLASKTDVGSWHGGYGFCRWPDDNRTLYFYAGNYSSTRVGEPIPQDEWVHLAGTFDGEQVMLYVNGEPSLPVNVRAAGNAMSHTTTPFLVGGGGGYDWMGAIDELVFYRRALTIQEVEKLMIAVSPPESDDDE